MVEKRLLSKNDQIELMSRSDSQHTLVRSAISLMAPWAAAIILSRTLGLGIRDKRYRCFEQRRRLFSEDTRWEIAGDIRRENHQN